MVKTFWSRPRKVSAICPHCLRRMTIFSAKYEQDACEIGVLKCTSCGHVEQDAVCIVDYINKKEDKGYFFSLDVPCGCPGCRAKATKEMVDTNGRVHYRCDRHKLDCSFRLTREQLERWENERLDVKNPQAHWTPEIKKEKCIYCPECLKRGETVEVIPGTSRCPRCYLKSHRPVYSCQRCGDILEDDVLTRRIGYGYVRSCPHCFREVKKK